MFQSKLEFVEKVIQNHFRMFFGKLFVDVLVGLR